MQKVQKRPRAILPLGAAMSWFEELDVAAKREPGIATTVRLMFGADLRESTKSWVCRYARSAT